MTEVRMNELAEKYLVRCSCGTLCQSLLDQVKHYAVVHYNIEPLIEYYQVERRVYAAQQVSATLEKVVQALSGKWEYSDDEYGNLFYYMTAKNLSKVLGVEVDPGELGRLKVAESNNNLLSESSGEKKS